MSKVSEADVLQDLLELLDTPLPVRRVRAEKLVRALSLLSGRTFDVDELLRSNRAVPRLEP